MTSAYDKAGQSMRDWGRPDVIKAVIAKRIIEVASQGVRDSDLL
jgi:hypothetical protein